MIPRVLIADNDAALATKLQASLASLGIETAIATNGLDCVDEMKNTPPDLLVVEWELSWGGGDGVLSVIKDGFHEIPVVVLLTSTPTGVAKRLGPPVVDWFVKPISEPVLLAAVQHVLLQSMRVRFPVSAQN